MRSFFAATVFLANFLSVAVAQSAQSPAIYVELDHQKPFHLQVTLKSGAATTATFYQADLPWGIRDSMVYSAVRPSGEPIDLIFPTDDPGPARVSIKPGETLVGDIDLRDVIRDLSVTKKSDVLLFWAYRSPQELHIPPGQAV
jgi:hypothetical protein